MHKKFPEDKENLRSLLYWEASADIGVRCWDYDGFVREVTSLFPQVDVDCRVHGKSVTLVMTDGKVSISYKSNGDQFKKVLVTSYGCIQAFDGAEDEEFTSSLERAIRYFEVGAKNFFEDGN